MGEYAEMMLDGTLCQECGEYLGGNGSGFPEYCRSCQIEEQKEQNKHIVMARIMNELIASQLIAHIEDAYKAPFIKAIKEQMESQLFGLLSGIEILGKQLTHKGLSKVVLNNQKAKEKSKRRRAA